MRIVVICCVTVVAMGLICGCKKQTHSEATNQVFYWDNQSEPEYLDPTMASDDASTPIVDNLFEGLVIPHPYSLRPIPGVAESWTISPDGRIYTFKLRQNAKWTDGQPITAHDFVYTWRRAINPKTASRQASRLYYIKNGQAINEGKITDLSALGVTAVDDYTLRVTLEYPFPPFLELLTWCTFYPVRKDVVEKFGERWTHPENIVSNGPFSLVEWRPQKHIILKKNPGYWDAPAVRLEKVVYTPIEDTSTAVKSFLARKIDWIKQIPFNKVAQLESMRELSSENKFASYFYIINVQHDVLKDLRVRKALSLAIDRETLARQYLHGYVRPATFFEIPPGIKGYPHPQGVEFHPQKAKTLLGEAGFKDPSTFPKLTIVYNTDENHKLIAEVIQQMWKTHLGIHVELHNVEWKTLLKLYKTHDFQIGRYGGIGEYLYPTTYLESYITGAPGNYGGWSSADYDRMWKEALAESHPQQKLRMYGQMEKMLADDVINIPIYYYKVHTLLQNWVRGFYRNLMDVHNIKWTWISPKDRPATSWERAAAWAAMPLP